MKVKIIGDGVLFPVTKRTTFQFGTHQSKEGNVIGGVQTFLYIEPTKAVGKLIELEATPTTEQANTILKALHAAIKAATPNGGTVDVRKVIEGLESCKHLLEPQDVATDSQEAKPVMLRPSMFGSGCIVIGKRLSAETGARIIQALQGQQRGDFTAHDNPFIPKPETESRTPQEILAAHGWAWNQSWHSWSKPYVPFTIFEDNDKPTAKHSTPAQPYIFFVGGDFEAWLTEKIEVHTIPIKTEQPAKIDHKDILAANGWKPSGATTWRCGFHSTIEVFSNGKGGFGLRDVNSNATSEFNHLVARFEDWLVQTCDKMESNTTAPKVEDLAYRQRVVQALGWKQNKINTAHWTFCNATIGLTLFEGMSYIAINEGAGAGTVRHNPATQTFAAWAAEVTGKAQATITKHDTGDKGQAFPGLEDTREIEQDIKENKLIIRALEYVQARHFSHQGKGWNKIEDEIQLRRQALNELQTQLSNA